MANNDYFAPGQGSSGGGSGSGVYINPNLTTYPWGGIPVGSSFPSPGTPYDILFGMAMYGYLAPLISMGSLNPLQGIREKGSVVNSVDLTTTVTKQSNDITDFYFRRNGVVILPKPATHTGTYTYTQNTTVPVSTNTSFDSVTTDGVSIVTSTAKTYTFVYPYLYGVGAPGMLASSMYASLTHLIENIGTKALLFSPTMQVYYFGYPTSYGPLSSILDTNGFETISDWTLRSVTITGLDGTPHAYNVYEFNNITTQINFTNTFIY